MIKNRAYDRAVTLLEPLETARLLVKLRELTRNFLDETNNINSAESATAVTIVGGFCRFALTALREEAFRLSEVREGLRLLREMSGDISRPLEERMLLSGELRQTYETLVPEPDLKSYARLEASNSPEATAARQSLLIGYQAVVSELKRIRRLPLPEMRSAIEEFCQDKRVVVKPNALKRSPPSNLALHILCSWSPLRTRTHGNRGSGASQLKRILARARKENRDPSLAELVRDFPPKSLTCYPYQTVDFKRLECLYSVLI